MFLSTYESTTRMCGYRDEENMIRLRNCLKDDALNTVRSFLMLPSTVPKAISALKLRFGQPQAIINTLRAKVLGMPSIKADAMDKLIEHALAVQNLCSTIDACGRKEYKRDVTLLNELVGKLPPSLKLDWARHQRTLKKINLFTYSKWIYSVAEDACLVCGIQPTEKNQELRSKPKSKAFWKLVPTIRLQKFQNRSHRSSGVEAASRKQDIARLVLPNVLRSGREVAKTLGSVRDFWIYRMRRGW